MAGAVWYSSTAAAAGEARGGWWMEGADVAKNRAELERWPDAIHVTNASEVLAPVFAWRLKIDAAKREDRKGLE